MGEKRKERARLESELEELRHRLTETERAQGELERGRGLAFSLFEIIPATICLQAPDYSIPFANRLFRDTFGDPEGKACYDLLHGRSSPCEKCPPFKVFETGEAVIREWTNPLGRTLGRHFMVHYYPFWDESGAVLVLEMGIDITGYKKIMERLERLNRCFLELGTDPLENIKTIVTAGKDVLEGASLEYCRLGKGRLSSYFHTNDGGEFREIEEPENIICYKAIREGREKPIDIEDVPGFGYENFIPEVKEAGFRSFLGYPVKAGGKTVGCIGMFHGEAGGISHEVTDLMGMLARAIEVEEERLDHEEELRDFIDIASHELRHPMTIIKGYAATLGFYRDKMDDGTREQVLEDIEKGVERLERLVHQLLDTSRIERQKLAVEKTEVDAKELLERAVREMRESAPAGDISLYISGELGRMEADSERIIQVLVILVENAIHYSPEDYPVEVEAASSDEGGVIVSVLDRGWGVPEDERANIFERFYQVGDVTHHSSEGIGLGLYIARKIVENHDGRIWHEPREGGGSAFRFTLP